MKYIQNILIKNQIKREALLKIKGGGQNSCENDEEQRTSGTGGIIRPKST